MTIDDALKTTTDTRACVIADGAIASVAQIFKAQFAQARKAIIIADPRTWAAAGEQVRDVLTASGVECARHLVEEGGKHFHADMPYVDEVSVALMAHADAVPVAVGSGVINDLTKLASGRKGVPYMVVCTAASVDGYSSFGASICADGAKQTFACPAPRAIVAPLDVVATAPKEMAAGGYADLLAKVPAGADWLLASELGVAAMDENAWHIVQDNLPMALAEPEAVARAEKPALGKLMEGLMFGGFAMQAMKSSRPASGAEHLFSHLLDMRNHTFRGDLVSHGFQVGVYTRFMCAFYEQLLAAPIASLDVEKCVAAWPTWEQMEQQALQLFAGTKFPDLGVKASRPKYQDAAGLRDHLNYAKQHWAEISAKLRAQLISSAEAARRLAAVGAPVWPEDIGVTAERSFEDVTKVVFMRDRYNSFDFAYRCGNLYELAKKGFGLL